MKKSPRQGRFSQRVRWPSASAALFVWPKNSVIQICRADHLRFALFIYAKHTIKIEKSQSRPRATSLQTSLWIAFTQATLPRRDHGPLPPRKLGTFPTRGRQRSPASPQNRQSPTNKKAFPAHGEGGSRRLTEEVLGLAGSHQTRSHSTTKRRSPRTRKGDRVSGGRGPLPYDMRGKG